MGVLVCVYSLLQPSEVSACITSILQTKTRRQKWVRYLALGPTTNKHWIQVLDQDSWPSKPMAITATPFCLFRVKHYPRHSTTNAHVFWVISQILAVYCIQTVL